MIEIHRILCPIDFSEFSEHALTYAMRLSARYGAKLHVLHVMPPPATVNSAAAGSREMTMRNLQAAVDARWIEGAQVTTEVLESAEPIECILDSAGAFEADLVVTGSHGRSGVQRVLLGSVVEALLHRCDRPMLTVPSHLDSSYENQPVAFERIVCAVDFSEPSLNALAYALAIAEESEARLTLLHVIAVPPELLAPHPESPGFNVDRIRSEAEAASLTRLRSLIPEHARDYCTIETAVLEGGVSRHLLQMANTRRADLLVLGVRQRNPFDLAFFGSNSKDLVRQAHCPVLVVPAARQHGTLRAAS